VCIINLPDVFSCQCEYGDGFFMMLELDLCGGEICTRNIGILHRDLKASNVLVHSSPTETGFDSSITVAGSECSLAVAGTAFWRAPEIL
jgi:serine/threonine protein kinase